MPTRSGKSTSTDIKKGSKGKGKAKVSDLSDNESLSDLSQVETDPEPGTDPDNSTDDDELPQIFAKDKHRKPRVEQFLVLGVFPGKTRNSLVNLMVDHGAEITNNKTSNKTSHIVMSDSVWHNRVSSQAIRHYSDNNHEEAQTYPDDPDRHRVWFLSLEWVNKSIKAGKLEPEEDYDFEKREQNKRKEREEQLAEERKQHGGQSIYKRGERQKLEREKKAAELDRQLDAENATTDEPSSDGSSPVQRPSRPGNPLSGFNKYNDHLKNQSTLNQHFFNQTGYTLGTALDNTTVGSLAGQQHRAGGGTGPLSGVGPSAIRSANSTTGPSGGAPAGTGAAGARAGAVAQSQPRSLGAIDLTSGDDSEDVTIADGPPSKRQKTVVEDMTDDYDW